MDDTTRPRCGMPALRTVRRSLLAALLAAVAACQSSPPPRQRPVPIDAVIQRATQPGVSAPALVNGDPVSWGELQPRLAEAAGRLVLEEVALERVLEDAFRERGLALSLTDIDREREILLQTVDPGGERDRDQQLQLLEAVRVRRGLGERRLEDLLRRSAMLRKLVADRVEVTESMIGQRHETLYGERFLVRAIVLPTEMEASRTLNDLLQPLIPEGLAPDADAAAAIDPAALRARFIDLAIERSTDQTGLRGGLLEPISAADPTYPLALRQALPKLEPGRVHGPVAVDAGLEEGGFALLLLEERLAAEPVALEQVRGQIAQELRLRQERILMGELAERMLTAAEIRPLDPGLRWSWEARER